MNIFKREMYSGMSQHDLTEWYCRNRDIPCLTTIIIFERENPTDAYV